MGYVYMTPEERIKAMTPDEREKLKKSYFPQKEATGKTVELNMDAKYALQATISILKLNGENREVLEKAMNLYADLRMKEAIEAAEAAE